MLKINIKGTGIDLSEALKKYAGERVGEVEKFLPLSKDAEYVVDIQLEKVTGHHKQGAIYRCDVNINVPGKLLRVDKIESDMYIAIDSAGKELLELVKKYREKSRARRRAGRRMIKFMRGMFGGDDE